LLWTHSAQRFRTSGSSIVTLASNGNHHVSSCPTSTRFRTSTHLLEQSRKSSKPRPAAFSNHIPTPGSPLSRPGIWFAELAHSHAHITSPVPPSHASNIKSDSPLAAAINASHQYLAFTSGHKQLVFSCQYCQRRPPLASRDIRRDHHLTLQLARIIASV
jgi:hypothetical protein